MLEISEHTRCGHPIHLEISFVFGTSHVACKIFLQSTCTYILIYFHKDPSFAIVMSEMICNGRETFRVESIGIL